MLAIRTLLSDALALYRRYPAVAVLTCLPGLSMVLVQIRGQVTGDAVYAAVVCTILTIVAQGMLSIYGLSLEQRMLTKTDSTWTVQVHGMDLGVISDVEYASLRHHAAFSVANYLRQIANLCEMALNSVRAMTRAIPFLAFWIVIGGLLLDTTTALALARKLWAMAQTSPDSFAYGMAKGLVLTLAWGAVIYGMFMPNAIGFCNQFRADLEHSLRRRLNLPTTERPDLYRLEGNERVPAAERAEFRAFMRARLSKAGTDSVSPGVAR
ncbi:hypothetical protein D9X30_1654 (plasmid) [Cupriavidus sp. U2]|uniref:hypothetical protein n=1 Tax=Cupriavidus sp. U2 TaxID=2920269 RepID=UPI00129E55ED|nr:hypothetical protein [Cupriavidus sp. U2]KAI3593344.1 hypothetical protein D9X30_1654 [Cupriavidus sp. U2]